MKSDFSLPLVLASCIASAPVFAQSSDSSFSSSTRASSRPAITAEIKPLPTLLSVIPGVGALGVGLEGLVHPNAAVFAEATVLDSNLPGRINGTIDEKDGRGLHVEKLRGSNVDIGGRYYGSPGNDSWYTGAKVGYTSANAEWTYKDEELTQHTAAITPGVSAGYRWRWDSSVVLRVGAGASANLIQKQEVTSPRENADVATARDDLDDNVRVPVLANVDLGLGYMF